jgi:lipopolysaccharide transport system ATP-binding protein
MRAIVVENLGKEYQLGTMAAGYDTLRDQVMRLGALAVGRHREKRKKERLWALRHVSLEVEQGEVVGVVGRNGAGKTTLLRLLSRISEPTEGRAEIRGRLGSLLEVGTGFHPELTGRENVFLNGAILGMTRAETARKFDEIVDFAGIERFIDTPVKRYSSGMYVRLAFAVAAHLEPEILLVDEVLAVGDAEFQKKCLGKMQTIGREGRTVFLVSHSMPTIARLCDRAILMDGGRLVDDGDSSTVVARYLQGNAGSAASRTWDDVQKAPGNDFVRLRSVRIVDSGGKTLESVDVRTVVGVEMTFDVLGEGPPVRPQFMLTNEQGGHGFNAVDTRNSWREVPRRGRHVVTGWIPGNLLNEGLMTITVFLSTWTSGKTLQHVLERDVVSFHVIDPVEGDSAKGDFTGQWGGAVRPLLDWTSGQ